CRSATASGTRQASPPWSGATSPPTTKRAPSWPRRARTCAWPARWRRDPFGYRWIVASRASGGTWRHHTLLSAVPQEPGILNGYILEGGASVTDRREAH